MTQLRESVGAGLAAATRERRPRRPTDVHALGDPRRDPARFVLGGRLGNLSTFRFRWAWLAVAGLLVQLVLFTPTGDELAGNAGPAIYVASTLAVFVAVARNIRLAGMPVVAPRLALEPRRDRGERRRDAGGRRRRWRSPGSRSRTT